MQDDSNRSEVLLEDYAGPFLPEFDISRFSCSALALLGREWLLHGHMQDRVGMPLLLETHTREQMTALAIDEWMVTSPIYSPRVQRALRFNPGDVAAIFKNMQLDIGAPHGFMDFRYRLLDDEHGEFWLAHCGALMDVEPMGEEFVRAMCHDIEDPTFDATAGASSPLAQIRPIHRPPRRPADRTPHCHWKVDVVADATPTQPHPNEQVVRDSLIAGLDLGPVPAAVGEGWADYSGPFDPDFRLERLSQRALVTALQEVAVQSHLLFRGYLVSVAADNPEELVKGLRSRVFTGLAGLTASRLKEAAGIKADDAHAIAKVFQLHPMFHPRAYVSLSVEVVDERQVRVAFPDSPIFHEADGYTWLAALGGDGDRALTAIARAVNPRAQVHSVDPVGKERFAYIADIDPSREPQLEEPETSLARISTGANFRFAR